MTFDMIGMALMALMIMLVIGGGTTWAYLAGQRDSHGPTGCRPGAGVAAWRPAIRPADKSRSHRRRAGRTVMDADVSSSWAPESSELQTALDH